MTATTTPPATFTELLPPTKSNPKGYALDWTPAGEGAKAGLLVIKQKRIYVTYSVTEFDVDWQGRGFALTKLTEGSDPTEERYSCFLAKEGSHAYCDCKGFHYTSACKHVSALQTLIQAGQI
jgi:hypothetical protein